MRIALLVAVLAAGQSFAQAAPLGTARLENGQVTIDRGQGAEVIDAGCTPIAAVIDQQLFVACDDGRIKTFSLEGAPALVSEARVDGEVRALYLHEHQVWVELAKIEARPLRQVAIPLAAAAPVASAPAPAKAVASPSGEPPDTVLGPVRPTGFVVGGGFRLMVPIGVLAIGGALEASATWYASFPFAVRARVFPLGGVTSSSFAPLNTSSGFGVAGGSLDAMFDGRYFAAGLGVGFGQFTNFNGLGSVQLQTGFTLTQLLRIGALDGLCFSGQTQLVMAGFGFAFHGGEATVQIPFQRKWLLQLRGGGSIAPFAFGDVGMRIGLGDAERAKFFLVPSVGITFVRFVAGPSVGLAAEYRL